MKKIILFTIIMLVSTASYAKETKIDFEKYLFAKSEVKFKCDGRQHYSQMRSCAEAKFFIDNCPNTKMDGDHDGKPCEKRCGH